MSDYGFNKGYFPFCVKKVASADAENNRYNGFFDVGFGGVGKIYPVGMPLEDAMALYWRLKYINWYFIGNREYTTNCGCYFYRERSSIGPYWCYDNIVSDFKPPDLKEGASSFNIIRKRACSEDIPYGLPADSSPSFTNAMRGPVRYYSYGEGPTQSTPECAPCPNFESDEEIEDTPMSCFFRPCAGLNCGSERNPEFARVLYEENSGLYYPSFFCFYYTYSRLWTTQKFLTETFTGEEIDIVTLELNNNSYDITLYAVYNYTQDSGPPSTNHGTITCSLATIS